MGKRYAARERETRRDSSRRVSAERERPIPVEHFVLFDVASRALTL